MAHSPASAPARHWKWLVCLALLAATVINYLDRQTVSIAFADRATQLELGLDKDRLGVLFWAFYITYALSQVAMGVFIDRTNVKRVYAIGVAGWSIAGAAAGLATGFWGLLVARVVLGIFESVNWPAALRIVSRTFPPKDRATAVGIFQSGTSIGTLVAPVVVITLTQQHSWRFAFYIVGAVGLLWTVAWLLWYRPARYPAVEPPPVAAGATSGGELREILRSRRFWGLAITSFFLQPCQYFYTGWLPTYFVESGVAFGDDLKHKLTVAYLIFDAGLISGGLVVAWLARRRDVVRARRLVVTCGALLMPAVVLAPRLTDLDHVVAVVSIAMFGLGWFQANYLTFAAEVSAARVSTVTGILGSTGAVSGAFAMLFVGHMAQRWGFGVPIMVMGLVPVVALGGLHFSLGRHPRAALAVPALASADK